MMNNRIKELSSIELNYETIRREVRGNLELTFRAKQAAANKRLSYMRAIRAVSYTLCVCMAAGMIGLAAHKGGFDWLMGMPGETVEEPSAPTQDISPGRVYDTMQYFDRFFAFCSKGGRMVHSNVILNSDLLGESEKAEFEEYDKQQKQHYYNFYLGVKDGKDSILITHMTAPYDRFVFFSGLEYSYEEVIGDFENLSNMKITDEMLTGPEEGDIQATSLYKQGIFTFFKQEGERYVTYFQADLDGRVYVVNKGEPRTHAVGKPEGNDPDEVSEAYKGKEKDMAVVQMFDRFFAFGSESPSTSIPFEIISHSALLSEEDKEDLKMQGLSQGDYFHVYLGTKDGVDTVILVNVNDRSMVRSYRSALAYRFEEIIAELELMSGLQLDDSFLTASNFDYNQMSELSGVILCFREESCETDFGVEYSCIPYYKAQINGKIYVVNP